MILLELTLIQNKDLKQFLRISECYLSEQLNQSEYSLLSQIYK